MSLKTIALESLSVHMFPDGRMDVKNAAKYLGLKEKTLAVMRSTGTGPQFIKRGRIFYFKEDLDAWINAEGKLKSTTQLQLSLESLEEVIPPPVAIHSE